jgi:hypothetical protein
MSVQVTLFPTTGQWNIMPWDRENKKNIDILRDHIKGLIRNRRDQMKKPNFEDKGDLLSILL